MTSIKSKSNKPTNNHTVIVFILSVLSVSSLLVSTKSFSDESDVNTGIGFVDFRLRYESVNQNNALKDAQALTLRTLLHYHTKNFSGFSAGLEFEDSRNVIDIKDYNDAIGHNPEYSVIADPNTTEFDQGFVQYQNNDLTAKLGRQVIVLNDHRFVGSVGWRQDKQSFDAVSFKYKHDKFSATYAYINKRNRIFADKKDIKSSDHIINASYQFNSGKLTAYSYLLEIDNIASNSFDTFGLSFDGKTTLLSKNVNYHLEYAMQTNNTLGSKFDADYINLEGDVSLGKLKLTLGFESLGSDNGQYGFSTPLATLHKFNGWSDQFLATPNVGLDDLYLSASTKLLGGKFSLAVHKFNANDNDYGVDDLGSELNVQYIAKFATFYNAGIKFASYSSGDHNTGKVDTDKVWFWVGARF